MPHRHLPILLALLTPLAAAAPAAAQIRPETSGSVAHEEPEMKKHGSGLTRPNVPRHLRSRPNVPRHLRPRAGMVR